MPNHWRALPANVRAALAWRHAFNERLYAAAHTRWRARREGHGGKSRPVNFEVGSRIFVIFRESLFLPLLKGGEQK